MAVDLENDSDPEDLEFEDDGYDEIDNEYVDGKTYKKIMNGQMG